MFIGEQDIKSPHLNYDTCHQWSTIMCHLTSSKTPMNKDSTQSCRNTIHKSRNPTVIKLQSLQELHSSNTKNIWTRINQIILLDLKVYWNQSLQELQSSNTKNIWTGINQIILLDLKVYWNQAQNPSKTPRDYKLMKLDEFKPVKPPKNFHHKSSNIKNIHPNHQSNSLSFIGIKFQNLQKLQEL